MFPMILNCIATAIVLLLAVPSSVPASARENSAPVKIPSTLLPSDRATTWQPGMMAVGGIPSRTKVCAELKPRGGEQDDAADIQRAIDDCPAGQIVQLSAGKFLISSRYLLVNKGITVRGAGPGQTVLEKPNGAKPNRHEASKKPFPLVIVGPSRFSNTRSSSGVAASTDLAEDAKKGAYSVRVTDTAGLSKGQIVLLDEASGASWQTDPQGRGQVWASPDFRVVWKKHKPRRSSDDYTAETFPTTPKSAGQWHSRLDRPTAEVKQVASVSDGVVTFTTPIHISYRTKHRAQLSRYGQAHVLNAGIEDLKLVGGDRGNLIFQWAGFSWARNVDSTQWLGVGVSFNSSFRIELRKFYVHDAAFADVGGGAYALGLQHGTSEVLIENGIVLRANKLIVARSAGAGSVVGYNYMDMAYIRRINGWIEVGLNASHRVGPHHVLFEGNYGHNADNDQTHGNSIYHTFFRNHLRCIRAPFANQKGGERIDDAKAWRSRPKRCIGQMAYSYWMSFLGNVLGARGQMQGWSYETTFRSGKPGIWMLGWDGESPYPTDRRVAKTALRHGNFDYLTNRVKWDPTVAHRELPDSLYLTEKPSFFNDGRGYKWPWGDPTGKEKLHALPAKVRYDAGTPFTQP